jgi:crotonobetainyl-CoA:carnitine CoA-transferase CaiB-like acyl-CoA transferase
VAVIRPAVEVWARTGTTLVGSGALAALGMGAGPSTAAAYPRADPPGRAPAMGLDVPPPAGGAPLHVAGNPIKLSASPDPPAARWPRLGEHTDEILAQDLGLDAAAREALRAAGVIA